MAKKKTKEPGDEISFEHSFKELQDIVSKLEDGNLSLSDSLSSYELGIKRLKECYRALNDAENRIRKLTKLDTDGNLQTSEFEIASQDEADSPSPRGNRGKRAGKSSIDEDGLF